ncbi:ABC transporter permease [Citricoccus muralis]|uniref:Transport permease protein n=1 Tax=Citricoccus muralis TaxID=169134 RepID=A0ABY8H776_9MICC|nr:ABC transporter permease [Citricoccus muralis]WFP16679.1 ABC transporter permease [Citricoccus muralis]
MSTTIDMRGTNDLHPATGTPRQRGAGFSTALRVFSARSLKHSFRDGESLLMAVLLPLMLMLVFTFILGGAMNVTPADAAGAAGSAGSAAEARGAYLAYVLPAIALTAAGFGASYTAVVVANDVNTGFMNRLRTMPFPVITVLLGHTVSSLVRNLMATAVVVAAAFALGFRTAASPVQILTAIGLIMLWILVITCVFTLLGLVSGSAESASGYGFMLLFLPYISSGFAPVETMPGWLQGFAGHQPMTPIIDASRALFTGEPWSALTADLLVGAAWCAGFIAVSLALIAVVFPRKVAR